MGILRKIALVILAITLITFIALFGSLPALRNTPIGYFHRTISIRIPRLLQLIDQKLFRGRLGPSLARLGQYLMHEKHPVVMIIFLSLVTGSAALFLSSAWQNLPRKHHLIISVILPAPYLFTWLCARPNNSTITSENLPEKLAAYPYDHVIFHPGKTCRTCKLLKPARSKHCSICRACVARLDHHCVWVNNCIGKDNYRWFLALVATLVVLLVYATYLAYTLLTPLLPTKKQGASVMDQINRWSIAISREPRIGAVGLLSSTTAPLAGGLFAYHIYLIWAGTTTSETAKWRNLREDMADGLIWKGSRLDKRGSRVNQDIEPPTKWPVSSDQILVETDAGNPPRFAEITDSSGEESAESIQWKRCWRLADVDNIYDLGFWDNLLEVLLVS